MISFTDLFTISTVTNTRGHSAKLTKHRCHLDLRRYFFSERVVDRSAYSLPQDVIDADSLNTFRNGLDHVRSISICCHGGRMFLNLLTGILLL